MNIYAIYTLTDFDQVKGVIQQLKSSKSQVWFDDRSRENRFSNSWANVLRQKIERADLILFFLSKNSIMSEYCLWEAETAISLKKPTAMILVDQTALEEYISIQSNKKNILLNEALSSFRSSQISTKSNNDTYVSTITAESISGAGNQVVGQQTVHNGTPVWLVGLTTAGTAAITGYVTIKVLTQVTETYKVIFENLIKVIKTIGEIAEQHSQTDEQDSIINKMSQEHSNDHMDHSHGNDPFDNKDESDNDETDGADDLDDYPDHINDDFTNL